MAQTPASTPGTVIKAPRVSPSLGVGLGVVVVYATIFTATAASSGIPYTEWFSSAPNVWRTAVLPLALGAVFLIGFLAWARWDSVFRDHNRLAGPRILRIAAAVFIAGIVVHLVFVDWAGLDPAIVTPILITGVLVGFCEETLFRGILLRGTRTKGRSEATAAIVTSVAFGLFHLTNIVTGSPVLAVLNQVLVAALSGIILYSFRRISGLLVVSMIAHGLWDTSLFLPTGEATTVSGIVGLALLVIVPAVGLITLIMVGRRDRYTPALA